MRPSPQLIVKPAGEQSLDVNDNTAIAGVPPAVTEMAEVTGVGAVAVDVSVVAAVVGATVVAGVTTGLVFVVCVFVVVVDGAGTHCPDAVPGTEPCGHNVPLVAPPTFVELVVDVVCEFVPPQSFIIAARVAAPTDP